ncbi:MAG: ABC transporter substrate-binding protein [Pseudomonadota bacterium]
MRNRHFAIGILVSIFVGLSANAFEIEAEVSFGNGSEPNQMTILSTTDVELFAPIIKAFRLQHPDIAVKYTVTSSGDIITAVTEEGLTFDVVISSAMDLQTKLANDGYARRHSSEATALVPEWGKWRDSIFAFTQEPAAIVLSLSAFEGLPIPHTRQELIETLRKFPNRFHGRLGTYDVRDSGLGYLFATQDSRTSDTYWRFTETFGGLNVKLYCCSSKMIDDVLSGDIAVAYNVLGSYASARDDASNDVLIIEPEDYTTVMLRTALIMGKSKNVDAAEDFIDHLLELAWAKSQSEAFMFPNKTQEEVDRTTRLRPIRLGPGLLVNLDRFKREKFIREWENSILQ